MRQVYMCLTTDIVTIYALNRSWDHLDSEDFSPLWTETIKAVGVAGAVIKQFPWVLPLVRVFPREVVRGLDEGMGMLLDWQEVCRISLSFDLISLLISEIGNKCY